MVGQVSGQVEIVLERCPPCEGDLGEVGWVVRFTERSDSPLLIYPYQDR
jgi:hypothetical protein